MSTEREWSEYVLAAEVERLHTGENARGGQATGSGGEYLASRDEAAGRVEDSGASPEESGEPFPFGSPEHPVPPLAARRKPGGKRLVRKTEETPARRDWTPSQRLLILDSWRRSGLPASDFAALVGVSKHTLYAWKKAFEAQGPAGLMDHPKGAKPGSRLPELTKRAILMLKETNPQWGCQRISDALLRGPALPACPTSVARVLHEAGYELEEVATAPHPDKVRSFERARPNQLWQTDLFTFVLKRQNRRVYLVAFMDDHSRFLVSYGLHASQSTPLVLEVLRAGIAAYGPPEDVLSDNGSQYVTWRGKSAFSKELEGRGIRHVVARPRHPQTLGKIERFWGTLWRECLESALFIDLEDARRRIGLFIDHYNFQRPHQGIDGLVPGDRFFGAAADVLRTLKERVAANALELARHGIPKQPFYVTGQVAGQPFSVHAEGERVILTRPGQPRQEVELVAPEKGEGSHVRQNVGAVDPESPPTSSSANSPVELPLPVCPDGSPRTPLSSEGLEEPCPPGVSPLDAQFPPCSHLAPRDETPPLVEREGYIPEENTAVFMAELVEQEVRHEE